MEYNKTKPITVGNKKPKQPSKEKGSDGKPSRPPKRKLKKLKDLTAAQEKRLKEHEKKASKRHVNKMRKLMREGMSFKQAHVVAVKMGFKP